MPTQTKTASQTLEERAARASAELQSVQQERDRLAQIEADELASYQSAVDEEVLKSYDPAALEVEVREAKEALNRAIEEDPLTRALTTYFVACARRREMFERHVQARGRRGEVLDNVQYPPPPSENNLADSMNVAAERLASQWRQAFADDFAQRRENPDHDRKEH